METSGVARKSAARIVLLASMCLLTNFALCALAQTAQKSAGDAATASTNGSKFTLGDRWIQVQGSILSGHMEWVADSRSRLATLHRNPRRIFSHAEKWFHPQLFLHEADAAFCRP